MAAATPDTSLKDQSGSFKAGDAEICCDGSKMEQDELVARVKLANVPRGAQVTVLSHWTWVIITPPRPYGNLLTLNSTLQPLLHTDPPPANCGNICASLLCPQQPKNCIKKRKWKRKRKELFEILKSQLHKTWEKRVRKPRGVGSLSPLSCFNTFTTSGMCKVLGTLPGCF